MPTFHVIKTKNLSVITRAKKFSIFFSTVMLEGFRSSSSTSAMSTKFIPYLKNLFEKCMLINEFNLRKFNLEKKSYRVAESKITEN